MKQEKDLAGGPQRILAVSAGREGWVSLSRGAGKEKFQAEGTGVKAPEKAVVKVYIPGAWMRLWVGAGDQHD